MHSIKQKEKCARDMIDQCICKQTEKAEKNPKSEIEVRKNRYKQMINVE